MIPSNFSMIYKFSPTSPMTKFISNMLGRRGVINSAPVGPARKRFMNRHTQPDVDNHNRLSVKSRRAYKPGYSESDLTSQSEDEVRRQNWDRRGTLEPELPPHLVG